MSDENPTLRDIWRLLGGMNKRLEAHDRQFVELRTELKSEVSGIRAEFKAELAQLRAEMQMGFGSLKASIEARDFRLDEQGRRLTDLETLESK